MLSEEKVRELLVKASRESERRKENFSRHGINFFNLFNYERTLIILETLLVILEKLKEKELFRD